MTCNINDLINQETTIQGRFISELLQHLTVIGGLILISKSVCYYLDGRCKNRWSTSATLLFLIIGAHDVSGVRVSLFQEYTN